MAVRNTERLIPGGFDKAVELGETTGSVDGNYVLVSYLTSPLRIAEADSDVKPLINTYVLFVNTDSVAIPSGYIWTTEFFREEEFEPIATIEKSTSIGVFELDSREIQALREQVLIKVVVNVFIEGTSVTLSLAQEILGLDGNVEAMVNDGGPESISKGGNAQVSRIVANDYRQYFVDLELIEDGIEEESSKILVNLVTSIIYLNWLRVPREIMDEERLLWEEYLNEGRFFNDLKDLPIGIAQIRPIFFAMFLTVSSNGGTAPLLLVHSWDETQENYDKYLQQVFELFQGNLELHDKIHIFNLLRFPKSAINVLRKYLWALFALNKINSDQPLKLDDGIFTAHLVWQYLNGPCQKFFKKSNLGTKAWRLNGTPPVLYSSFNTSRHIEFLGHSNFIQFIKDEGLLNSHRMDLNFGHYSVIDLNQFEMKVVSVSMPGLTIDEIVAQNFESVVIINGTNFTDEFKDIQRMQSEGELKHNNVVLPTSLGDTPPSWANSEQATWFLEKIPNVKRRKYVGYDGVLYHFNVGHPLPDFSKSGITGLFNDLATAVGLTANAPRGVSLIAYNEVQNLMLVFSKSFSLTGWVSGWDRSLVNLQESLLDRLRNSGFSKHAFCDGGSSVALFISGSGVVVRTADRHPKKQVEKQDLGIEKTVTSYLTFQRKSD